MVFLALPLYGSMSLRAVSREGIEGFRSAALISPILSAAVSVLGLCRGKAFPHVNPAKLVPVLSRDDNRCCFGAVAEAIAE